MSRFLGVILAVVGVAALVGAAIGWRFPFLGQSRSSNQLETAQQSPTAGQPETRTRVLRTNQPATTTQAQNPRRAAPAAAPATDPAIDPEGTGAAPTNSGQPVRALW